MGRILVVDGAPSVRESVRMILGVEHEVALAGTPDDAARAAGGAMPDLVLAGGPAGRPRRPADAAAPWVEPVRRVLPPARVLSIPLPFAVTDLRGAVRRALAEARGQRAAGENPAAGGAWRDALVAALLDAGDAAAGLRRVATRAAETTVPVLLAGERGTGRETLARWVHATGPLARGPFVAMTCAGLSPAAFATRLARLPAGERVTLFLKGLDDASPGLQRAVLELLESGAVAGEPPDDARIEVEVRPIASVSDDAAERVERGELSDPLLQAFAVLKIELPPLRDHPALLAAAAGPLLARAAGPAGRNAPRRLAPGALERLALYCWPGNLRELANVLARSAALAERDPLEAEDLEFGVTDAPRRVGGVNLRGASGTGLVPPGSPEGVNLRGAPGTGPLPPASAEGGNRRRLSEASLVPPGSDGAGNHQGAAEQPLSEGPSPDIQPGGADRASTDPRQFTPSTDDDPSPTADLRRLSPPEDHLASFARELAHELKNPLVAIKTFTQLLGERFGDAEFRREFYAVVRREVERIDHLVQGVLHAAGAPPEEPRPLDLNCLLDAVLAQSEAWMVERRVVAFKDLADGLPPALTDPARARAAVFNVVARALASLPPGDDLFLATRGRPALAIVVRYEDASAGGTGEAEELELALARAALERAGGRLVVERGPRRRTTVTLEFPPAEARLTA